MWRQCQQKLSLIGAERAHSQLHTDLFMFKICSRLFTKGRLTEELLRIEMSLVSAVCWSRSYISWLNQSPRIWRNSASSQTLPNSTLLWWFPAMWGWRWLHMSFMCWALITPHFTLSRMKLYASWPNCWITSASYWPMFGYLIYSQKLWTIIWRQSTQ